MRDMDATWKQLAADGEFTMKTRAVINGVTYDTITAPVITRGLLQDNSLSVGNCIAGTLKFTVMTSNEIPRSAMVVIESCLSDGTTDSDWHDMGTFWVDKRTVNSELIDYDLIDLECYDAMLKGNQAYSDDSPGMNWPKPMETVVRRIAVQMGVQIDERTRFKTGDDYVVTKPDDEMTLLDILGYIGALHGGNWTITPENKLRLVPIVFQQGGTYDIVDENNNHIVGNGDKLVWKYATSGDVNNAGGGLLNVPVVTGEINTFGVKRQEDTPLEASRVLGTYRLVSGAFAENESYIRDATSDGADTTRRTTQNAWAPSGQIVICRFVASFNIPSGIGIKRVYCDVNGRAENLASAQEYMCVQLVSGTTPLSEQINFKDISNTDTTYRLECTTIPTHEQLASMELECTFGYFGGVINGATFYVEYQEGDVVSRVTITVDKETAYTAGSDGGIEIKIDSNPYGTQRLCDALFAEFEGTKYAPFEITRAIYDPAAELGDWIVVGDRVTSVLYNETQTLDIGFMANASAPGEEEVDNEYPYISALKRTQYTVQELSRDNVVIKSEIRQTQDAISLEVSRAEGAETALSARLQIAEGEITSKVSKNNIISEINQTSEQITINASKVNLDGYVTLTNLSTAGQTIINGANISTGTLSASKVNGGQLSGISIDIGSGNFNVNNSGILTANGATINGSIKSVYPVDTDRDQVVEISSGKIGVSTSNSSGYEWYIAASPEAYGDVSNPFDVLEICANGGYYGVFIGNKTSGNDPYKYGILMDQWGNVLYDIPQKGVTGALEGTISINARYYYVHNGMLFPYE